MKIIYKKLLQFTLLLFCIVSSAQNVNVTIDLEQQRFLGNESNLDRAKYFNIHDLRRDDFTQPFFIENNIGLGRRFFGPFNDRKFTRSLGQFPTTPATRDGRVRPVRRFITTVNPENSWRPGFDREVASNAAVRYFVDFLDKDNRPEYWEPFNEPFVKAGKDTFTKDENGVTVRTRQEVINEMALWFRDMARKIHGAPELAQMKVIGFSSAFPSYARRDFSETWQNQTKLFIDVAGEDIDAISVHPYDGINIVDQDNFRSGSNSEAILDLVETYSAQVLGKPKKIAISEYGVIEQNYPRGPAPGFYNPSENAIAIRGLNNMIFNFLERQDNIEITIPFITGRSDFFYDDANLKPDRPYVPAISRPTEVLVNNANPPFRNDTFVLTDKANFYRLWKEVKGDRATVTSNDLDVQAQVFVDGNVVYLALNNLDDGEKTVDLNFISGPSSVTSVLTKTVVIKGQDDPFYNLEPGTVTNTLPSNITLRDGETSVIKITYDSPIQFTKSIVREKYYAVSPTQTVDKAPTVLINANTANTFNLSNINKGTNGGSASLRITVGIPLRRTINPTSPRTGLNRLPSQITFNGTQLPIPTNWKGYDQDNRSDFFGTFELNVPYNIINDGDNTVTVTYAQTGGRVACVVLSLERKEGACSKTTFYADNDNDGLGDPNDTIESCSPVRGYVDNANDKCLNDNENTCLVVEVPGTVEAENFVVNNGTVATPTKIISIINGDFTEYDINATGQNFNIKINAAAPNDAGGTISILSNATEIGTINIIGTGGFNTFQVFETDVTLPNSGLQTIRLAYSGTGNSSGLLFDIDSIIFGSNDPITRFTLPVIETITTITTQFTVGINYTTISPDQRVIVELRRPDVLITPTNRRFLAGSTLTPPTTGPISNQQVTITIPASARPLIPGEYPLLTSIRTPRVGGGFTFGLGESIILRVEAPTVMANDDRKLNQPRDTIISTNILDNDVDENGNTPTATIAEVDIDTNTNGTQNTLTIPNEGTWEYNPTNGILSFTPNTGFVTSPTDISYTLTINSISDTATVNFEYVQPPVANDDVSENNAPGVVTINLLNNDTNSNGILPLPTEVTVDLDPATPAIDTTLSVGVLGGWSYNNSTGIITFTPNNDFIGNPPALVYLLTELATGLNSTATITINFTEVSSAGFTLKNTGETCADQNNGTIEITSDTVGDFSVAITGTSAINNTFTENLLLENLNAGDYELVITNNNTNETVTFEVTIAEPQDLRTTTSVSRAAKQVTLNLLGSNEYTIQLNNEVFTTTQSNLTLDLKDGENNLLIEGERKCQGEFSQKIFIGNRVKAYPNPVINNLTIETGNSEPVLVNVYDISGALLVSETSTSPNGISEVQMSNLSSGIYFVTVNTTNSIATFKIVK